VKNSLTRPYIGDDVRACTTVGVNGPLQHSFGGRFMGKDSEFFLG
jgi:hypothetical protein